MARVALFAVALVALLASAHGLEVTGKTFGELAGAINRANKYGEACKNKQGCLGEYVKFTLTADITMLSRLPTIKANSHFILVGNCTRKLARCTIDAQYKYPIFQGAGLFVPGVPLFQMYNLILQKANGGVLNNVFAQVVAQNIIFRANINGVINNAGAFGGYPQQNYTKCRWVANNGTAINAGNGKYGVANSGTAFFIKRSQFIRNTGTIGGQGGAVYLAGFGKSVFENTAFIGNVAGDAGGAVYADETTVKFRGVSFKDNVAKKTGGGAVFGSSGFYQSLYVSFCQSSFNGNKAPLNKAASSLLFKSIVPANSKNIVSQAFCSTAIPPGSVLVGSPLGTITTGNGTVCFRRQCF